SSGAFSNLEIKAAGQKAVLLVGPNTAGTAPTTSPSGTVEAATERYVVAPMRDIEVPESSIPGLGSATTLTTVGRYAWWVGDEGVKASYTLVDPHAGSSDPTGTAAANSEARLRLMTAARSG